MNCITVKGNRFYRNGQPVLLRGIGVGSWLNLEHYELGLPGWDGQIRKALTDRCPDFMDAFTRSFFTESDAAYLVSLGIDFIRVPVNHHLFWDETASVWRPDGFALLHRLGEICERSGLLFLLDMHTVPGGQNPDWHSECRTGTPEFWHYRVFRDTAAELLRRIAAELKDCDSLLGYDILNEPVIPEVCDEAITDYFLQAVQAIRREDARHLIFLEGDFFAMDFIRIRIPPAEGIALSPHFYPGVWQPEIRNLSRKERRNELSGALDRILRTIPNRNLPLLCGETGFDHLGEDTDFWQGMVEDMLDCLESRGISWCLWNYKDIGPIGLVSPDPACGWMNLCSRISSHWNHHRAEKTGYDIVDAAEAFLGYTLEKEEKYAMQFSIRASLAGCDVRHILLPALAAYSEKDLLRMAEDFRFENCRVYQPLEDVLKQFCRRSSAPPVPCR